MSPLVRELRKMGACEEARAWAKAYQDLHTAWASCERGDWMLWLSAKSGVDRKQVVLAACACARLAMPYVPPRELRPLRAIETAEAWCQGEATINQVRAARRAAAAADDAAAFAAASAAYAAAAAFCAADDAGAAAAAAAFAAAYAAADDEAAAARANTIRYCADICRSMLPVPNLPGPMGAAGLAQRKASLRDQAHGGEMACDVDWEDGA